MMRHEIAVLPVLPRYVAASLGDDETGTDIAPALLRAVLVAVENDKAGALLEIDPRCPPASAGSMCRALDLAKGNGMPARFKLALVIHSFEHMHAYRFVECLDAADGANVCLFSCVDDAKHWLAGDNACG